MTRAYNPGWGDRVLFGTLFLSIAVHSFFLLWRWREAVEAAHFSSVDNSPIEISRLPPAAALPKSLSKAPAPIQKKREVRNELEIVETEDAKNKNEDPKARFLSDRTQSADEEMKSKRIADFSKTLGTGPDSKRKKEQSTQSSAGEAGQTQEAAPEGLGSDQLKAAGPKKDWKSLTLRDLSVTGDGGTPGASDDRLDNINEGGRTVLSTREFRYFSYYHRIKELLRQYWKPMVEGRLYHMWQTGKPIGDAEVVTKVLVLLDEQGRIEKIARTASSGFDDIDQAAIDAFNRAGPFPNPPKGIVEEDGFVRIRWDFILKTEAVPRIQFQTVGNVPQ